MSIKRLVASVVGLESFENKVDRLDRVCTETIEGRILNHREMWDPISEEEIETGTVDEMFHGKVFLVGNPVIEYRYNGKMYIERYDVEHVDLLRDVLGDNYEVRIRVNPNKPSEIKLDMVADMMTAIVC